MNGKLTPRLAMFAAEYLINDGNGTRAAIAVGVPERSAHVTAARWLKNAKVRAAIEDLQARAAQKYDVTIDKTVRKLAEIAYGDLRDWVDEDGKPLPLQRMTEAARTMIAGLEVEETDGPGRVRTITHKFKTADRIRALELLGKYQKMFDPGSFSAQVDMGANGMPADSSITIKLVRPA